MLDGLNFKVHLIKSTSSTDHNLLCTSLFKLEGNLGLMVTCFDNSYNTGYLDHALLCMTYCSWWSEIQSIQSNEKKDESISESLDRSSVPLVSLSDPRVSILEESDFDMSSKEYLPFSDKVSDKVDVGCNSLIESLSSDGICQSNSLSTTTNTNQGLLSTIVWSGVCGLIPTPCRHLRGNDKVLNQNHESRQAICDSSTYESRKIALVSCDSSTRESRDDSSTRESRDFEQGYCSKHGEGSAELNTTSTLGLPLHQRREDVHRKKNTKEERLGDKVLKSSFQSERLQKILMDGEQQCTLYSVRQEFKSFGVTPPPLYSAAFELKMPAVPMVPMTLEDPIVSLTTTNC